MPDSQVKGNQGKRYSVEEKAEMAQFIADYNAKNKRGGMKAASEKYGVSVVTLSNWGKAGKSSRKKKSKAKKTVAKKITQTKVATPKALDGPEAILSRLQAIRSEIKTLENEFDALKKKL